MNEPSDLDPDARVGATAWERASQAAVDAVRAEGDRHTLFVSGYGGASPGQWARNHPQAWVRDAEGSVRYEAHQYFDSDRSGRYQRSFAEEEVAARGSGIEACG